MVGRSWRGAFLIATAALGLAGASRAELPTELAELRIELKDGRVFILPFERHEVARMLFDGVAVEPEDAAVRLEDPRPRPAEGSAAEETGAAGTGAAETGDAETGDEETLALAAAEAKRKRGRILQVGPGRPFALPSEAAAAARDGDTVEIYPGTYQDVAIWRANRLTIRGVGGRPRIDAGGGGAAGKAVWVIAGRKVLVENVELTGSRVPDKNGAGIRAEGGDLTLREVLIHGNEIGILSALDFKGELRIERSEFHSNIVQDWEAAGVPPGHNIYIGEAKPFVLIGSWIHGAVDGHNVKSRASENRILYNRIEDDPGPASSYLVDIAEGAPTLMLGNLFAQSAASPNKVILSIASEKNAPAAETVIAYNTILRPLEQSVAVANRGSGPVRLVNNLIVGPGRTAEGGVLLQGTLDTRDFRFVDPARGDWRPAPGSPAIDAAIAARPWRKVKLEPSWSYRHPLALEPRTPLGRGFDLGAYEAGP